MTARLAGPPPEFLRLLERYCQLGRLLPRVDGIVDEQTCADAELVLAEMAAVKAEIEAMLAAALAAAERTP
jgi:hypothetical protein